MAETTPDLPLGAAEWVEPTEAESAASAVITPAMLEDAARWAREVGGEFASLLDAEARDE